MASKYDSNYYHKVSVTKGHHVYKAIWMPTIGEKLSVQFEEEKKRTIVVIKDGLLLGLFSYLSGLKLHYN